MKQTPILFSAEMIRAEREGRKTMTRRIIKDPICTNKEIYGDDSGLTWYGNYGLRKPCPYGQVGDRLWVKESHYAFGHWEHVGQTKTGKKKWRFVYDGKQVCFETPENWMSSRSKVRPSEPAWYKRNSLFMPRWASRTTLEITSVKAERLQDITEEDAMREGVDYNWCGALVGAQGINWSEALDGYFDYSKPEWYEGADDDVTLTAKDSFTTLWEKINGVGSWSDNNWVFAIGFKRVEGGAV